MLMLVICFLLFALAVSSINNGVCLSQINERLAYLNQHYKFYETEKYDDRFEARERRKASEREKMRKFAEERKAEAASQKAAEYVAAHPLPAPTPPRVWKESRLEKMKRHARESQTS